MRRRVDPNELGPLIDEFDVDGVARVVDRLAAAPGRADAEPTKRRRVGPAIRPGFVERGAAAVREAAYQDGRRLGRDGPRPGERVRAWDVEPFITEFRRGFRAGRAERAVSAGTAVGPAVTIPNSCVNVPGEGVEPSRRYSRLRILNPANEST